MISLLSTFKKAVKPFKNYGVIVALIILLFFIILPHFLDQYGLYVISITLVMVIAVIGLNITMGYAGQVSLCHAAFMGVGAYITALFITHGHSFWIALLVVIAAEIGLGIVIGYPSLKVKHMYLALVTLGFGRIFYVFVQNASDITGGPTGIGDITRPNLLFVNLDSDLGFYYFILASAVLVILSAAWIAKSKWGRAFKSLRVNEVKAAMVGVDIRKYKLLSFVLGAIYAGVGGCLYACLLEYIGPSGFTDMITFRMIMMLVIGGLGRLEGAILGAGIVTLLPEALRAYEQYYILIFAAITMIMIIFVPKGGIWIIENCVKKIRSKVHWGEAP
jgi:branched-chain amino acid transport system permease protein